MRCRKCDYRLWNLRSRQCPECGTPFVPSQYEFVPNSVEFRCPHCDQAYVGTDPNGHLVPAAFECVSCGRHIHMDEMVLLPAAGIEEEQTQTDRMPWLERKKRGFFRSWFSTIGRSMITPGRLMRSVPAGSSVASAWWFAIWTNTLILLVSLAPLVILQIAMVAQFTGGGGPPKGAFGAVLAAMLIMLLVGMIVGIAVWGCITHGLLRLTGPTFTTLGGTYQAICYSSGAFAPTAIPCLGFYFGWIWWIVSAVLMVKQAQRVQGWRAALAVLTFPALLIFTIVGFYVVMIVMVFSSTGPFASAPLTPSTETQIVLDAVLDYAEEHAGRGPDHAIELVSAGYLTVHDLVALDSDTYVENVSVAGVTLDRFSTLPAKRRGQVTRAAIDALPEGTIAHRLGDFVFTHHGIDLADPPPELWLVIMSPDPEANAPRAADPLLTIGCADGGVRTIPRARLTASLAEQNDLRARHGLAPLPDPATVTHARPAVAQP